MLHSLNVKPVAFFKTAGDVPGEIGKAYGLKEPDPADTTHRAVDIVVSIKGNALTLADRLTDHSDSIEKAKISILELVNRRKLPIFLNDL